MHLSVLLGIVGLVAVAAYKLILVFVTKRQHAARAKQLGCQPAPLYGGNGILGLDALKELQEADKAQLFPDMLERRMAAMSAKTGHECNTFRFKLLGQEIHHTSDPKNIQAILATQFDDFCLGNARRNNMMASLGDGIFVQDGKAWEHSRAMLRPNFARDQVSNLELEERHVQDLLKVMPVQADGWTAMTDIQTLFFRLTIDSACEFLFGESVDSQLSEAGLLPVKKRNETSFSYNFDSAMAHLTKRFRLSNLYWLHNPKEFRDNNKVINEFIEHYVERALQAGKQEKQAEEGEKDKYVFLEALATQTQDPVELRAQLLNILLAGRDTTASLLAWLFHLLLRNPAVFEKLRQTIIDTFGTYDSPRDISFSTLKGCSYLQHSLNETLRLWTVVPLNTRSSTKATTLPRGGGPDGESPIFLGPNAEVQYTVHVMHRRKDIWGEDAAEFRPERFEGRKSGWEFVPFNGGPRICLGQQFALTEASYVTVRLLQKFDKLEGKPEDLEARTTSDLNLTSCPARKVTLKMREARRKE